MAGSWRRRQPRAGSTIRGTTQELIAAARQLRRTMTPAEQLLWEQLRARRLQGLFFRRQHPFGPFILDFCCPRGKLVVEVDGSVHDDEAQAQYDLLRTERLRDFGYTVLRFRNEEVEANLTSVLHRIAQAVSQCQP
ncbi:MAG: endonuclease domain-containing protein [Chloroflexota bacterium]